MSKKGRSSISRNELIAIEIALEAQIDSCEDFLSDPDVDFLAKPKLQETLRWTRSALSKIQAILEDIPSD